MTLELRPNEYVKIEVHFSYKVFVLPTLLMSIGILMFLAVWSGVGEGERFRFIGHIYSVAGIMMMIGGLLFIPYIYKRVDNKLKIYAVTNQRVYVRRGIINIKEKDIPLAKINDVQVIEKNTGEKIQWEQDGYRLSFDDDALSVKVTKYQGDEARTLDVCMDRGGDLMLGTQPGGRYVAQIEIPAATYTETPIEPEEGTDESGDTNRQTVEHTKNPLDMAEVKLILWSIE